MIQVGMPGANPLFRQEAQTWQRVEALVTLACLCVSIGSEQQVTVFGNEEKEQPVHEPQQLPIVVLRAERASAQTRHQRVIRRMRQEAPAQRLDGLFDAAAQLFECPRALILCCLGPLFQPALRPASRPSDAGLVAQEPSRRSRHRPRPRTWLQVELDECLPGQADVVAEDSEPMTVGDEPPEAVVGAVQQLCTGPCGLVRAAPATPAVRRSISTPEPTRWTGRLLPALVNPILLPPPPSPAAASRP